MIRCSKFSNDEIDALLAKEAARRLGVAGELRFGLAWTVEADPKQSSTIVYLADGETTNQELIDAVKARRWKLSPVLNKGES